MVRANAAAPVAASGIWIRFLLDREAFCETKPPSSVFSTCIWFSNVKKRAQMGSEIDCFVFCY